MCLLALARHGLAAPARASRPLLHCRPLLQATDMPPHPLQGMASQHQPVLQRQLTFGVHLVLMGVPARFTIASASCTATAHPFSSTIFTFSAISARTRAKGVGFKGIQGEG